jgi:hypothetical protein
MNAEIQNSARAPRGRDQRFDAIQHSLFSIQHFPTNGVDEAAAFRKPSSVSASRAGP